MLLSPVTWTGAAGDNNWDTGGNWSTNTTPGAGDDVTIDVPTPVTITHSAAVTDTVNSLVSNTAILLSGGTLNVNATLSDSAPITLAGGTLGNAVVQSGTTLVGTSAGGTLSNVTLDSNLDLQTNNAATVTITTGLTLNNANIEVGNASGTTYGVVNFSGDVTVGGSSGSIVFGGNASNQINLDASLTLGTDSGIVGGNGTISGSSGTTLINHGSILENQQGDTLLINLAGTFTNDFQVEASAGTLTVAPGTLSNFSAGTLSGGVWAAEGDGGVLRLVGDNITTEAATITVLGSNSHIYSDSGTTDALAGLTAISTGYELTIGDGANFTPVAAFRNSGTIQVTTGSTLTLSSANSAQIGSIALLGGTLASSTGPLSIAGGLLSGHGTIASSITLGASTTLQLDGFLSGSLVIEGDLVLDGLLQDGIDGKQANAANGYEQLAIRGAFTNNGTINDSAGNGFVPGTYDNLKLIEFASRSGTGSVTVNGMNLQSFFDSNSLWLLPSSTQTLTVTTTADSGAGSLRDAIIQANAAGTFTVIAFDMPTSDPGYNLSTGAWTITPVAALPVLTVPVIIDGASQPGFNATPVIVLSGVNAGSNVSALVVTGGNSTIKGLVINQFSGDGIDLTTNGGNVVEGDYIGTDVTGTAVLSNSSSAIFVQGAANTIGGLTAAARNVIAGTGYAGIRINGTSTTANTVENNYIGVNAAGTGKLGSLAQDIGLEAGTSSNTIGTIGAGNVLAGAAFNGISVYNDNTNSNVIAGNYIGTDASGTLALGNSGSGIGFGYMYSNIGASNTQIVGNLISANGTGIGIDSASHNTLIAGNYIGTNAAGTASLANGTGVYVGGYNNTIGGTTTAARNIISGNVNNGVDINGTSAVGNVVEGNFLGTDVTGTISLAIGSRTPWTAGVMIENGAQGNLVGTNGDGVNDAAEGNLLSGNIGDGVAILDSGTNNNIVAGNLIGSDMTGQKAIANGWDGILITFGAQYNRIGANGTDVDAAAERNVISGNIIYGVEIGRAGTDNNWVAGNYIGTDITGTAALANENDGVDIWTGAQSNLIGTNGDGVNDAAERNVVSGNANGGVNITGTGANFNVVAGNYIGTDATGSQALGNGTVGQFYADGVDITAGAQYNRIGTDGASSDAAGQGNVVSANRARGIVIDGSGSNYNIVAGNLVGTDASGASALGNAVHGVEVRSGAQYNRIGTNGDGQGDAAERNIISGNAIDGISLYGSGANYNIVAGNYIGTDATGTKALGNAGNGVLIAAGAANNIVGTSGDGVGDAVEGNVISGNNGAFSWGVYIGGSGTNNNVLAGNYIGTDKTGTQAIPNGTPPSATSGGGGVILDSQAAFNRIGTNGDGVSDDLERNVISGNSGWDGLMIQNASNNVVAGNYIGLAADGSTALGNGWGIDIKSGSQHNRIGVNPADRDSAAERNVISGNRGDGIGIWNAGANTASNVVAGNYIGTDATGTEALGNAADGIQIYNGAQNNIIGGTAPGTGNVISGNSSNGVDISDAGTTGNVVEGNYIGTNAAGTASLAVGSATPWLAGVMIQNGAHGNLIGTNGDGVNDAAEGNLLSGNIGDGVALLGSGTNNNIVAGNLIGTDGTGTTALSNAWDGILITSSAQYNRIGANGADVDAAAERNVISGNDGANVEIGRAGTNYNWIAGNYIGTNSSGTAALPNHNTWLGVWIWGGAQSNVIGTNADGSGDSAERNVISGNAGNGIVIQDAGTAGNVVAGNYIGTNASGTAALGNSQYGVYLNTAWVNSILGNTISGNGSGGININGNDGLVSFYAADGNANDSLGGHNGTISDATFTTGISGQAFNFDGLDDSVQVANSPDLSPEATTTGEMTVSAWVTTSQYPPGPDPYSGQNRRAIVAKGSPANWEYALNLWNTGAVQFSVWNPNGASYAEATGGILPLDGKWHLVTGTMKVGQYVRIYLDGTLVAEQDPGPLSGSPVHGTSPLFIGQRGGGQFFNGQVDDVALFNRALSSDEVSGLYDSAGASLGGAIIQGNRIGTNAAATAALGNGGSGILIQGADNTIGGTAAGSGNVISGNRGDGILISGLDADNNVVAGNYIGTDPAGTAALGNAGNGVNIVGGSNNRIGANSGDVDAAGERNVISGNSGSGVSIAQNITVISSETLADQLNAGQLPRQTATGTIAQADLSDQVWPAPGNWPYDNPVPGGGGTNYAFVAAATLQVNTAGTYTFALGSDDGSRLRIDGQVVVDEPNPEAFNATFGSVLLSAGTHTIEWTGYQATQAAGFELSVAVGGGKTGPVTTANGWHVLGDPSPDPAISLQGSLNVTVSYSVLAGGQGNVIAGNYIGTNAAGTAALANSVDGILLTAGASSNTIGGTTAVARNVISGNTGDGVNISGAGTTNNTVEGNYIGTDVTGAIALANNTSGGVGGGVDINNASGNLIGGLTSIPGTGAGNVISGNGDAGIFTQGTSAFNLIEGNLIGTDATGTLALGNGFIGHFAGVRIASPNNTVGGTAAGARNVISANAFAGVQISGQGTVVQGNYIGTDIIGSVALGNQTNGVAIGGNIPRGPENILIGGTSSAARNVISGNMGDGINISASIDFGNLIQGNYIGTNAADTAALANSGNGITISNAPGNTIGGKTAGAGNVIAFNAGAGVAVTGSTATGNAIRGNLLFSNTGLAIDLGGTGTILANDSQGHNGPNNFANYPIIQAVTAGPTTVVTGTLLNASTPGTIYYLDFYANTTPNPSGHGDAQVYLGSTTVTTDSTGLASFSAGGLGATSTGQYVTVTATDQYGNTSEFALNAVPAVADSPPSISISGPNSLPASGIPIALGSNITDSQTGKSYTYAWNVTSTTDPSFALPAGTVTDEPNLTFTPSASGTYVATLTVTDSLGGVVQATPFSIAVGSGGQMVAIANSPASAAVNTPLTLTAAITEPSGVSVTNYDWNVTLNGAAYTQLSGPTASALTFTPTMAGNYVATLTATNSVGATGSASVSFSAVTAGVAIQGAPGSTGVGTPITVGAAINDPDLSGTLTYNWSATANGTTVASEPANSTGFFSFAPKDVGTYTISLTVSDASNHSITADPVNVQVVVQAPRVSITGAPTGVLMGTSVSLDSVVTVPVGLSTTAYTWSILKDGVPYTPPLTSDPTSPNFSFTPNAGGLYTVILLVTDTSGTVGGTSVSILASSGAVAIGGLPPSVGEGTPVTLTAAPVDPNLNGTLTYSWSVTNTAGVPAVSGTGSSFTFTPPEEGSYAISLTASDSSNQVISTTSATLAVTNVTPTVTIAGVPANPTAGAPITLTGSAATPGSSDTFTLTWSLLDGSGQTTTGKGSTFTFTPTGGANLVTLTATDEAGDSASTSVVIAAAQAAGGIQLSQVGSFQEGASAVMQAALSSPSPGVSYNFAWTVTGQSVPYSATGSGTLLNSASSSFTFNPPAPGVYLVSVTSQGSDGSAASATQLVTVANVPPTVTINGLPSSPIAEGTPINLLANVSDPGLPSDVMKYQWTVTGPDSFTLSGSAANLSFTPNESGIYSVAVTVTDASGDATTATASITIAHVAPVPVIQNAPGTGFNSATSTLTVALTASVPDPGGDDAFTYAWMAIDQTTNATVAATTGSDPNFSFTFNGPLTDSLLATVTVTDDDGGNETASAPVLAAPSGTTLTIVDPPTSYTTYSGGGTSNVQASVPGTMTQVLALALGNAKIDGSQLPNTIALTAAALGSGDTLIGGAGANVLQGDSGFNLLIGGSGPNTLLSTAGDTLVGGGGSNLFSVMPGTGESVLSGGTTNTLSFAGSTTGITLDLSKVSGSQPIQFGGYDGTSTDILTLQGSFQQLVGSGGADNLFAANNSMIFGGGGNDTLSASGVSNATLVAGSGNVVLSSVNGSNIQQFGGTGSDSLYSSGGSSIYMQAGSGNTTLSSSGGSSITQFGGTGNDSLYSSGGSSIYMQAGSGNTTLASSGGSSITQFGGTGNDSLYSSGGSSIYMQGGSGNTTLSSSGGSSITQFGGTGNDSLYSSGGSSVFMQGGSGNSTLSSSGGSGITQFGGTGSDSLYSSGGSSIYMQAGSGNTTLSSSGGSSITQFGGTGNDSLYSSGGSSIYMQGGSGNSTLSSTGGSSITQFGGTGNDSLYSSGGSSIYMQGGSGNATLSSSGGSSITQFGGTGNDSLYSSGGSSILMIGGSGNSTLGSSGGSSITQFGGSGNDSLYSSGGSSIYMQGGTGNSTLSSTGGSSITQFGGTGNDSLYSSGGSSIFMQGGSGNSTLSSSGGSSITQFGGAGNDSLYSSGGSSIYMQGGSGNSTLSSSGGSSITQFGGTGNDSLYSSGGSSIYMQGGSGNSTLSSTGGSSITQFGGTGNDSLYSSGGSSIYMQGGTGNSTLSSSGGSSITQFGGTGNDSLYSSGGSSVFMQGGSGNSTLVSSGGSSITQFGGTGNDSLYSSGGSSVLMVGGSGNSTLASSGSSSITQFGGTGNDSLYSSGGSSIYMQGGSGSSTLSSTGGSSITQFGGTGNDSLYSSGGSSVFMQGGSGNSTLASSGGSNISQFGGTGNDSLYSSGGSSVLMVGGSGNSTLSSSGGSSITQFGGTGNDSLYSSGGSSIYMQGGTGNSTLSSTGGSSITQFGGTGNDSLYSSGGSSVSMQGGSGNSTLSSTGGSSITQFGGSGNDSLYSSGGSSIYMQGGTGNSTLSSTGGSSITQFGGTGNDSLYSSSGSSVSMQGGSGNSTLASSGGSSITQFGGTGNDSLYSSGGSSVLMVGGSGNSTLSSSGGSSITQFGSTGNDSLYSSGGSSVLMVGGSGNSTLASSGGSSITQFGGTGNDSLYSSGGSSILMDGGSGNSTLSSSGGSSITQFGGTGNDSLYSSGGSSVLMVGGSGNTTLSSSGGSSITQFGGTGNDSLYSSGGSSIYIQGGSGNSTLSSSGGSSITQFGGTGNDSLYSSGGSSILMVGGSGTDSLTASGAVNALVQGGGATNDFLASTGGNSVSLVGGSGNDTLSANGGTSIVLAGLDGDNTFELSGSVSATLNDLSTFGQSLSNIDGATQGINTILFPGMTGGIHLDLSNFSQGAAPTADQTQNVAPGMNLSLVGLFQNVVGGAGNNWIHGNASQNLLQGGGTGSDTLLGGSGQTTLLAGSGSDSLVGGSGDTVYRFAGSSFGSDTVSLSSSTSNDILDFSQFGGPVNLNLASSGSQVVNAATGLTLTLANPLGITGVIDTASPTTPYNDAITGNSRGDSFTVGTGNDTFTGAGGDSFYFNGTNLGSDVLNEAAGTQNTLNFLGLGGSIHLDLSQPVNADPVSPGNLTLTLSNPSAFTTVVGTPFADSITGSNSSNTIIGAGGDDSLVGGSGSNYIQGDITQVVYLNFAGSGQPGDLIYTADEADDIQAALTNIYSGFNYVFTQDPKQAQQLAQMTGGQYIALNFGSGPAGGAANQLDVDHLHLNGSATIDITSFLGQASYQVTPTLQNIINLSATIAAHELGHLSGLQHQDAFGPIGSGIYVGVNPDLFYPVYTGPTNATQTSNDVMASPDSVGTTLQDAAGQTYLGERDLIKLAFNDTGIIYSQSNLSSVQAVTSNPTGNEVVLPDAGTVYQLGNLPALAVPDTLPTGVPGAGQTFAVTAAAVNATISTGQVQYYAFQGSAGEQMSFQVISSTNTLNPNPILPALELLDANGNLVSYAGNSTASAFYGAGAVNQHEFEANDSTLYDVTLPTTGTYYIGVTTLPISPSGNYQLFTYSFGIDPQAAGDTLVGGSGSGNDILVGSSGNDSIRFLPGYSGQATVYSGSGQDTVDLSMLASTNVLKQVTIVNQSRFASITTILPTLTTVTTQPASSPDVYGGAVTLTATVTAAAGTPTGSVTFLDNGQSLGSATLQKGTASLTLATLPASNHSITVDYFSDSLLFTSSVSQAITQVVAQAQPTFSNLTASQSIAYGTPSITLSGHLNANAGQQTIPAGESVTVTLSGISQSTKLDSSDNFTLSFSTSTVGASATPWTIKYSYGGDSNFKAVTDSSTTLTITTIPTTITVPSSTVTSNFGQPLTLTATVASPPPGTLVPAGSVDFFDSTTQTDLGSVVLSANGIAQLVTDDLPTGTQTITLTYTDPQKNFLSSSTTVSVTIISSIYVLNPTASGALSLSGNSSLTSPGLVMVDSNSKTALTEIGNANIKAASIQVVGGVSISGTATLTPAAKTGATAAADPLANLTGPSTTGLTNYGAVNYSSGSYTLNPGIYSSIQASGKASLTLKPGVYLIEGGGMTVTGNASIAGTGVFIYNTGSNYPNNTGSYGGITLSGNGNFSLSAPTTGPYAGVVIFQAHANTRAISLSGNAAAGLTGTIYAPSALLYLSGNASLHGTLVVNELSLTGNAANAQSASGVDADNAGSTAGQLLAGNVEVYVNNSNSDLTADELARIQDAVNAANAVVSPYGVTVAEVSDPTQANVALTMGTSSVAGGYGQGVLGCYTTTGTITLIQGWNWYAGADPTQIGANQYDFQTTVTHELGHALGLGHSSNLASVMYPTLSSGTAIRTLTTADLNIPDGESNADAQHAALPPIDTRVASVSRGTLPATNDFRAKATQIIDSVLLADTPTGAVIYPTLVAADMGWLRTWAWLMLGLGQEPNRISTEPDFAPDAHSRGRYLPSQPVFNQSAAGLGSNRKSTPSDGNPSTEGDLLSESESNSRTGSQGSRQAL